MTLIACLHSSDSNIALFDAACPPGAQLLHRVRPELLAEAEAEGGLTTAIRDATRKALLALAGKPDVAVVLLTCSTLGPAVEDVSFHIPCLRVDAALAEAATHAGGRVAVLCTVATTLEPTRMLFAEAAERSGASIEMTLVADAWDARKAGDVATYHALIAAAADAAFEDGAAVVALAQASMAPAAALCRGKVPLTSPAIGLAAAMALA